VPLRGADPGEPPAGLDLEAMTGLPTDPVRPVIEERDGVPTLLLFSSTDEVRRWRPSARFLSAPAPRLFELADRIGVARIAVDVAGREPVHLPAAGGGDPSLVGAGPWRVRAMAGPLDPRALFRLRRRLATTPTVTAAHLVEISVGRDDVLLLAVELAGVDGVAADEVVRSLAADVVAVLPAGAYAAVQLGVLGEDPQFAEAVRAADDPVYTRR